MDLNELAKRAHAASRSKGWWPVVLKHDIMGEPAEDDQCPVCGRLIATSTPETSPECLVIDWSHPDADVPTKLALIHSEISEALEAWRKPEWDVTKTYADISGTGKCWVPYDQAARVAYALPKPEGFPSELADIVIRCADLAGAKGWKIRHFPGQDRPLNEQHWPKTVGGCLNVLHDTVSRIVPRGPGRIETFPAGAPEQIAGHRNYWRLWEVTADTFALAAHLGINLEVEIERKLAYNATRPHRHGNRRG
jgi:hypothetical protein